MWDPLVSLAAAAAVTQRIRLATTTLPLPNRNEVLVAKQAAVIDRLSDGRLTLGVSLGSRPDDYLVFGATWSGSASMSARSSTAGPPPAPPRSRAITDDSDCPVENL
jgi:alkanesulfonate monooxygenase SsuD/methylene tetrahydromethanopterin reductase-like flavin-dependent oxidoreductase (luciferase family)